jgi:hypothetical protein
MIQSVGAKALSHADEVAPFLALLTRDTALVHATVAVGKGLHLAWRRESVARPGRTLVRYES